MSEQNAKRDAEIVSLYTKHRYSIRQIGDLYGLSKQRIQQVLGYYGITKHDSERLRLIEKERSQALQQREAREKSISDARHIARYGCTKGEAVILNGGHKLSTEGSLAVRFKYLGARCRRGGIEFRLTLAEYLSLRLTSRVGRGAEECGVVCIDKTKPLTFDNARLVSNREHSRETMLETMRKGTLRGKTLAAIDDSYSGKTEAVESVDSLLMEQPNVNV